MISDKLKAQAIAQLRSGYDAEDVAEDLEIPRSLVEEWRDKLDGNNLVALEAAAIAVQRVENGEIVGVNEDTLKNALEETAIGLAKQAAIPGSWGDMAQAKSVQLCADAVAKLYTTLILKNNSTVSIPNPNEGQGLNAFTSKMKD